MDKPKIDFSKLEEYSRATQKPEAIKAPPVQVTSQHMFDFPSRKPTKATKSKRLSGISTRNLVVGSLIANVVVMASVLAIAFWPKPSPLQEVAKAFQAKNDFKKKLAESCNLEAIEYRNAFSSNHNAKDPFVYRFKITFENTGHETLTAFPLELRAIRKGRPAADYSTSLFCSVKGGCRPGETLTIIENVSCSELRGYNVMQGFKLENGAVIEASVNGLHWTNARMSNDTKMDDGPDPIMKSLFNAEVPQPK